MANQTFTLGKDVTSINWVNGGVSFPVEELYIDGVAVWPDANWAKDITVENFKYRGSVAYGSLMSYVPYENVRKKWDARGEPWPLAADFDIYKYNKRAEGSRALGTQTYYYNTLNGSIIPSCTATEINALNSQRSWKIQGGTVPAQHLPFIYGATKGRTTPTFKSNSYISGDSTLSSKNEGINGSYYPIFYRKNSRDSIQSKEDARNAFLYTKRRLRVSNRRPSRTGFYFTDKKQSTDDYFTGIYTNKSSAGTYIMLGTYYPDFSESDLGDGKNFRFEIRVLVRDSEYGFNGAHSRKSDRMALFEDNVYYDKTLTAKNQSDENFKTVHLGRFSSPVLWTTDDFPDASNAFYGPIESSFTWEMPRDQLPWKNETFRWKTESGDWSSDTITHTYWPPSYDADNSPYDALKGFETDGLNITASS